MMPLNERANFKREIGETKMKENMKRDMRDDTKVEIHKNTYKGECERNSIYELSQVESLPTMCGV